MNRLRPSVKGIGHLIAIGIAAVAIVGCGAPRTTVVAAAPAVPAKPTPAPAGPIVPTPAPVVPIQPAPAAATVPTVVFIGDSISYLWSQPSFSAAFADHDNWNDQGLIGQNSSQLLGRFQADVVSQHPAIVHILTGTNDVYPGWVLCGGSAIFDTCGNIKAMIQMAQDAGITPILATIPPWGCPESNCALAENADGTSARYARIDQLNQWIKSFGADQGIVVIDYHGALVASDGESYVSDLTVDGVHPSAAGYALMTPMAEDAITAVSQR